MTSCACTTSLVRVIIGSTAAFETTVSHIPVDKARCSTRSSIVIALACFADGD